MIILGISAFYHDSAAALLCDGEIVAAAQEERFTRKKHDSCYPKHAIAYCLEEGGIHLDQVDYVVFYEKPFVKFERLLETYLSFAPRGIRSFLQAIPIWIKEKLFQKDLLRRELQNLEPAFDWRTKLLFAEHHQSHAASAFYPSPFQEAVILTMDGVGEWTTTSVSIGTGNRLEMKKEIHFPHSLGLLYSAFTYYTGFKVNSGEYKVMGLAPYGKPRYVDLIKKNLIDIKEDGSFRMDMKYFNYCTGLVMTNAWFEKLFGGPARRSESPVTQKEMDLAASIQNVTEEIVLKIVRSLRKAYDIPNLCLAGGVALNCVANGRIQQERIYDNIWIQPAAGDAGGALGAALTAYYLYLNQPRQLTSRQDSLHGSFLGPSFKQQEIETRLASVGAIFETMTEEALLDYTASALWGNQVVGWFQGRMEFGPRALGARSILATPALPQMQSQLNLKIKFRESFRPFAPAVLAEDVSKWFSMDGPSPYMLLVAAVAEKHRINESKEDQHLFGIERLKKPRSRIPAVTHVDYSARIQTVHRETNPIFYRLIQKFQERSGIPILVNTSFNVRGEPIVCTPEDAFRCFMGTEMDVLVVGCSLLVKKRQNPLFREDYKNRYELD